MLFSVIVVCLNPGEKIRRTMESIQTQNFEDYEVVIKDGGSTDGAVDLWRQGATEKNDKVRLIQQKDTGIYDAMNQAVAQAAGEFVIFLNCGDTFADGSVLARTAEKISRERSAGTDTGRLILYGDTVDGKNGAVIASASRITGFTCYRNIPCHQSCFYSKELCEEKPYDSQYRIRADYDHFLWCYYRAGAKFLYLQFPTAVYEGDGYSEKKENRARNRQEHKMITEKYMKRGKLLCYRIAMCCTLAPVRSAMAESRMFSGMYHWVKKRLYERKI